VPVEVAGVARQVAALAEEEALAASVAVASVVAEPVEAGKPLFRTCLNHEIIRYFNT
jgi:hypothetical protein